MLFQGQVQSNIPASRATGNPNALQVQLGELGGSQLLPRYAASTWSSQGFSASVSTAATITAFTGGGAGTPQIAVWNPAGTGKNLWPVVVNVGNVVATSAAANMVSWGLWYGPTAAITAAASSTYPINQVTLAASGSVAKVFLNTALTGATALTNVWVMPSFVTGAAATQGATPGPMEVWGSICIPPGSYMALGGSQALTAQTWIGSIIWLELPV